MDDRLGERFGQDLEIFLLIANSFAVHDKAKALELRHLRRALEAHEPDIGQESIEFLTQMLQPRPVAQYSVSQIAQLTNTSVNSPQLSHSAEVAAVLATLTDPSGPDRSPEAQVRRLQVQQAWTNIGRLGEMKSFLEPRLFGQDVAIDRFVDGMVKQELRNTRNSPFATLFLVGPPGTGKSWFTRLLSEFHHKDRPMLTIEMSGLSSANETFALTGMSQGYSDAIPGKLTSFIRENPRGIVVLDNFDKAHPNIQSVILPVFDTGHLTDQCGFYPGNDVKNAPLAPPEVDFRDCILVIVTNAGTQQIANPDFQTLLETQSDQAEASIFQTLGGHTRTYKEGELPAFSPELLSRLSNEIVMLLRPLDMESMQQIACGSLERFAEKLHEVFDIRMVPPPKAIARAGMLTFGDRLDARIASGAALTRRIFGPIIDALQEPGERTESIHFGLDEGFEQTLTERESEMGGGDIVRNLRRKQRVLDTDVELHRQGGRLTVRWSNPHWTSAPRAADIGVRGGLQVSIPGVSFEMIAGHDVAKHRLEEMVSLLRAPARLADMRVDLPKGMLLYGPPGTGKTMLAKALANCADLPFLSTTGPEMLDPDLMHIVFERAKYYAPSILFIDEVEVLGRRDSPGGYPVQINQLLAELDGFSGGSSGVFVVMATNYPERIDPAILRAGRIDLHVEVPPLDKPARGYFFEKLRDLPGGEDLDLDPLVRLSSGMSGADLERMKRELALDLVRRSKGRVEQRDAEEMLSVIKYGERRSVEASEDDLMHVAYHEAGHAVVARLLTPELPIELITIVSRARAAGFVSFNVERGMRPMSREAALNHMAAALAGRAAQRHKFEAKGVDAGASGDLEKATRIATLAVTQWGLDDVVGCRLIPDQLVMSQDVQARISAMVSEAMERASSIVGEKFQQVEELANRLLAEETILGSAWDIESNRIAG